MFCKYCGKEIEQDAKFCKHCGSDLNQSESNQTVNKSNVEVSNPKLKDDKEYKRYKKHKGLVRIVVLSILLVVMLITSFIGNPSGQDFRKVVNVDGVEVTYRYDYSSIDGETIVQKRYEGTDSEGNEVNIYVTVHFNGCFVGKIDENYVPTEADKMFEGHYYKEIEINGTINGYKVNDENEKQLIDSDVYEKYTDMIDEVKGCGLYIKFVDEGNSYTKIVTSRLVLLIVLAVIDLIAIGIYIFDRIRQNKIEKDEWGDREINIQHKIGIGIEIGALATLITSIIMFIVGVRWSTFLSIFVLGCVFGMIGSGLVKDCRLKKIVKIFSIIMIAILLPILLLLFGLGML